MSHAELPKTREIWFREPGEFETETDSGYDETGLDMGIYDDFGDPGTEMEGGYDAIGKGMGPDTGTSNMIIDFGVDIGSQFIE